MKKKQKMIGSEEGQFPDIELPRSCAAEQNVTKFAAFNGRMLDFRGSIKILDESLYTTCKEPKKTIECASILVHSSDNLYYLDDTALEFPKDVRAAHNSTPREDFVFDDIEQIDISSIRDSHNRFDLSDSDMESSELSITISNQKNQSLTKVSPNINHPLSRPRWREGTPHPMVKLPPLTKQSKVLRPHQDKGNPLSNGGVFRENNCKSVMRHAVEACPAISSPEKFNTKETEKRKENVDQKLWYFNYVNSFGKKLEAYKHKVSKGVLSSLDLPPSNKPNTKENLVSDITSPRKDDPPSKLGERSHDKDHFSFGQVVTESKLSDIFTTKKANIFHYDTQRSDESMNSEMQKTDFKKVVKFERKSDLTNEVNEHLTKVQGSLNLENDDIDLCNAQNQTPSCQLSPRRIELHRKKRRRISKKNGAKRLEPARILFFAAKNGGHENDSDGQCGKISQDVLKENVKHGMCTELSLENFQSNKVGKRNDSNVVPETVQDAVASSGSFSPSVDASGLVYELDQSPVRFEDGGLRKSSAIVARYSELNVSKSVDAVEQDPLASNICGIKSSSVIKPEFCCLSEMVCDSGTSYADVYKYRMFDPDFSYPEDDLTMDWQNIS